MFNQVKEFHKVFELPISNSPHIPTSDIVELRNNLLEEEYIEYQDSVKDRNLVEIADALADMIYVICGTAISYGIPLDRVYDEVHRSNMSKLEDGKPVKRYDGKILKGSNFSKPNIANILYGK